VVVESKGNDFDRARGEAVETMSWTLFFLVGQSTVAAGEKKTRAPFSARDAPGRRLCDGDAITASSFFISEANALVATSDEADAKRHHASPLERQATLLRQLHFEMLARRQQPKKMCLGRGTLLAAAS
jgi:hypothetical protein